MEQYKLHQLSLPDYDELKENVQRIYIALKHNLIKELSAQAAIFSLSIMYKVELEDLFSMWNVVSQSTYNWTIEQLQSEEVCKEMADQFADYVVKHYNITVKVKD